MNRSDLYKEYLQGSESETGTAEFDKMQQVFEDSMQGRLNKLQSTIEGIFTKAFNTDAFYPIIDAVTNLVQVFSDLTDAIGGGGQAMTAFLTIASRAFSGNIGQGISNFITNRQMARQQRENSNAVQASARRQLAGEGLNIDNEATQRAADDIAKVNQYASIMSAEQEAERNQLVETRINLLNQQLDLEQQIEAAIVAGGAVAKNASGEEITNIEQLLSYLQELKIVGAEITTEDLSKMGFGKMFQEAEQSQQIVQNLVQSLQQLSAQDFEDDSK